MLLVLILAQVTMLSVQKLLPYIRNSGPAERVAHLLQPAGLTTHTHTNTHTHTHTPHMRAHTHTITCVLYIQAFTNILTSHACAHTQTHSHTMHKHTHTPCTNTLRRWSSYYGDLRWFSAC